MMAKRRRLDMEKPLLIVGKDFSREALRHFFLSDITDGKGASYFGPSDILRYLPASRIKDTILFELDWDFPRSFNPLAPVPIEERSAIAEYVVEAVSAAYPSNVPTALLDNNLLAASLAMLSIPSGTLYAARHLFTSPSYRTRVIGQLTDPDLRNAWSLFHDLEDREQRQQAQSVLNRLIPLTSDPWYRNVIGQTKSFEIKDTDILVVDLPDSRKGQLLAALLMARLRGKVYIESPHVFAGGGQPLIATDYLDQLPEKLRTMMLGRSDILAFRLGVKDAAILSPEFDIAPQAFQLTELLPRNGYLKTDATRPFTLPESDVPESPKAPKKVRNRSRAEYAVPRASIELTLTAFIENLGD
jgi:hypothetical protein